jgi:hypothetical protein
MLASITPLGERGRGSTWTVTVVAFALGAIAAGLALGALLGAVGSLFLDAGVGWRVRLAALAVALAAALVVDRRPGNAPGPRRQVNERWLDEFRGWVYGLGFGAQLGAGVLTVVTSAATYAALLAALLSGTAARGALILGCAGLVRGLTPLAAARVRRPDQLLALHRALDRGRGAVRRGVVVVGFALLAVAAAGVLA